jgi:hypothetical protein
MRKSRPRASVLPSSVIARGLDLDRDAHTDQRTVQAAKAVLGGGDQLAGASGVGVVRDGPGGGSSRIVLQRRAAAAVALSAALSMRASRRGRADEKAASRI